MIRKSNVYVCVEKDLWGASVFTTETHHVVFLFLFSPHTLSLLLFPYLLHLAAQREKLSTAENSFLAAAASRELISVLDRREFFQVLKVFSLLSSLIFFKRERESKRTNAEWNCLVRSAFVSMEESMRSKWNYNDTICRIRTCPIKLTTLLWFHKITILRKLWRASNKLLWFRQFNFYQLRLLTFTSTIRLAKIACNRVE